MKATELIGRRAIRTKPIEMNRESSSLFPAKNSLDYSYTQQPIDILYATDSHIVYDYENYKQERENRILSCQFCDDNWIDYDELMFNVNKNKDSRGKTNED